MVFIPGQAVEVPDSPVDESPAELRINRLNTRAFIGSDPTYLRLRRSQRVKSPGGGYTRGTEHRLPEQRFKLIMQSPAGGSLDLGSGEDGKQARADYVLLGEYDADVRAGDFWEDASGNRWEVTSIIPTNSYEIRANVSAYGRAGTLEGG